MHSTPYFSLKLSVNFLRSFSGGGPYLLAYMDGNAIMNSLKDSYRKGSVSNEPLVCYEETDGKGSWAIKNPDTEEALAILEERLKNITSGSSQVASKEEET